MVTGGGSAESHTATAPARLALYNHLSELFVYPSEELVGSVLDGSLVTSLGEAVEALAYRIEIAGADQLTDLEATGDLGFGPAFIRLFEVPSGGEPCPLYGGALGRDRRQAMEDLLRYYRHFGLSVVNAEDRDLPDSIPTVLEFLGYLVHREQYCEAGELESSRKAQRDVLERHLTKWAPVIRQRVSALSPPPLYTMATRLLEDFTGAEAIALKPG